LIDSSANKKEGSLSHTALLLVALLCEEKQIHRWYGGSEYKAGMKSNKS
jgi:hypothetical protein